MIVTEAEARVFLGLTSSITDDERAALNLVLPEAEAVVIGHLGYDPLQRSATEYYPRADPSGGTASGDATWDVNASHTRAQMYFRGGSFPQHPTLQLERLPIRSVSDVRVDYDARHGAGDNAWETATQWVDGDDYWVEWDQPNYGPTGCLFASSAWPREPGTVRVTYRAGYSPDELAGRAATSGTDADGNISTARINAAGIRRAVLITIVKAMQTWAALKKSSKTGFTPGVKQSERLGDYQYSLGGGGATIASLAVVLPAEAVDALEPFRHWGLMRL